MLCTRHVVPLIQIDSAIQLLFTPQKLRELEYPSFSPAYRIRNCLLAHGLHYTSHYPGLPQRSLICSGPFEITSSPNHQPGTGFPFAPATSSDPLRTLSLCDWDRSPSLRRGLYPFCWVYTCTMNGVKTRSQAVHSFKENGSATANGHASPGDNVSRQGEERENIFLFIPNIIGKEA